MQDPIAAPPSVPGGLFPDQSRVRRMLQWIALWPLVLAVLPGAGLLALMMTLPEDGGGAWQRRLLMTAGVCGVIVGLALAAWLRKARRMLVHAYQNSLNAWRRQADESRVLLNSIGDAVLATNPKGKVQFLNPVAEKLTGWLSEEARGRPLKEVFMIFNERTGEPAEDPVAKVLRERRVVGLANHTVLRARDGAERPIEDSAAPILGPRGEMRGVILVFHDVSEKKERQRRMEENERRFRMVFNLQFQFICLLSPEGRVTEINDLPLAVSGLTREDVLGRFLWDTPWWRSMPEHQTAWRRWMEEAARSTVPVDGPEVFLTASGEIRQTDCTITAVKDEHGNTELFIVQATDTTERERATRALRESRERLQFLHDLGEETRSLSDPAAVMETVARRLGEHLGVSRCAWAEVEEDGERFTVVNDWTDGCASTRGSYRLSLFGERSMSKLNSGRTLVISNVDDEISPEAGRDMFHAIGIQAVICCPLLKNGKLRAVMAVHQTSPRRWNAGEVALLEDVSERSWAHVERVRSERELARNEERLRLAGRATEDVIWDWDLKTDDILWNEAIQRLSGYTPEEIGENASWWIEHVHPEDRKRVRDSLREVISGGGSHWEAEYRFLRKDGGFVWVLDRGYTLRDAAGEAVRMIGALQDQTERRKAQEAIRESQEQLKMAFDAAALGLFDYLPESGELRWDERCRELFGLTPQEPVSYRVFRSKLHPEDRRRVDAMMTRALSPEGGGVFDAEYRVTGAGEGGERWLRAIGRMFFDETGKARRFVGTVQDVTATRRAEEELRQARDLAEAGVRARDTFLASLSHELRTPLTPVLMTAAALREDPRLPEDARAQLAIVQRNVELEARLIDDLLDLTLIARRRFSLHPRSCELHSLVDMAVEIVREEVKDKELNLELDLKARRTTLEADPARLQQVLWNLLRNAVKFTPRNGRVVVRTRDSEDGRLVLEISDTGIGIASGAMERIFEPFEQGALQGDHRYGGMGLGLAIAKTIVDMHGGVIRAASEGEGKGATFTVELPNASAAPDAAVPEDACDPQAGPHARGGAPARKPLRLLVVEDHAATLFTLRRLLERDGHTVTAAECVDAALKAAEQTRAGGGEFDLVVSDLGLPDGTGFDLMNRLRREYGLRGIALSGYGLEEDLRLSREAGFVNHLIKPVKISQLREALEAAAGELPERTGLTAPD